MSRGVTVYGSVRPDPDGPTHAAARHDNGPIVWFDADVPVVATAEIAATWSAR